MAVGLALWPCMQKVTGSNPGVSTDVRCGSESTLSYRTPGLISRYCAKNRSLRAQTLPLPFEVQSFYITQLFYDGEALPK